MPEITRRQFIQGAGAASAVLALNSCVSAQTAAKTEAPVQGKLVEKDRKMNIAIIGVGGMGSAAVGNLSGENVVALCDVDLARIKGGTDKNPKAKVYQDYRKMFDEMADQIDGVAISTPDHMHYPIAKMAMELGKHVYVQKPCSHTIWEAREMARLAKKHNVVTQMGNQGHAGFDVRRIKAWVDEGALGDVTEVHCFTDRPVWRQNYAWPEAGKCPESLDWNLWCGTSPLRHYPKNGMHFGWRGFWDYGCGALGDMGCHVMDASFFALDLRAPDWVEAISDAPDPNTTPNWSIVTYHFPQRGHFKPMILRWYDGKKLPPIPHQLEPGRKLHGYGGIGGQYFIGTDGCLMAGGYSSSPRIFPETRMKEVGKPKNQQPTLPGGSWGEWVNACKGGPTPSSSLPEYGSPLTEMVLLGNLAIRSGKRIYWDAKNFKCINDDFATSLLTQESYREF